MNHNISIRKSGAGFSLMEMVIVVGIFVIAFLVVTVILINTIKNQRQINAMQEALSETKIALEMMARNARLNRIDYGQYGGVIGDEDEMSVLYLSGGDDDTLIGFTANDILCSDDQLCVCEGDDCLAGIFTPILSEKIIVNDLDFYISPRQSSAARLCGAAYASCEIDGYSEQACAPPTNVCCSDNGYCNYDTDGENTWPSGNPDFDQQSVTIVINAEATTIRGDDEVSPTIQLQTTVASRWYQAPLAPPAP